MTNKKLHILAGLLTALVVGWPCLASGLFSGLWGCLAGVIVVVHLIFLVPKPSFFVKILRRNFAI